MLGSRWWTASPRSIRGADFGVITWAMVGAAGGAAGAAPFGLLYGAIDALLHFELTRFRPDFLYFSLCGAAAGAIVAGFGRVFDREGLADLLDVLPHRKGKISAVR